MAHDVTNSSLLLAVRDRTNQAAWQQFEEQYRPRIASFCRERGAQDSDIDDVTQNVMLRLMAKLELYDRQKGRFRNWLARVASNCWRDLMRERQRQLPPGWDQLSDEFGTVVADAFDYELLEEAQRIVRARVTDKNWLAFVRVTYDEVDATDVGSELRLSRAAVYQATYRIRTMLRAELTRLEDSV